MNSSQIAELARRYRTPEQVQKFLRKYPYNKEKDGETLRTPPHALHAGTFHCLEAAMLAAAILEHHGYPPLVMSLESIDQLDHVIYVFQQNGKWGSIGRSRDPGLHGRAPVFKTPRDLVKSYLEPFVDSTGRIKGWAIANLDESGCRTWRTSPRNVWKVEQFLIDYPHYPLRMKEADYRRVKAWYDRHGSQPRRPHWW